MIQDKKLKALVEQYVQVNGLPDDSNGSGYILAMTDSLLKTHTEYRNNIARVTFRKTIHGIFSQVQRSQDFSHPSVVDLTSDKTLNSDDRIRMDSRKRKSDASLSGDCKRKHTDDDDEAKFSDSKAAPSSHPVDDDCLAKLMRDAYKKRCNPNTVPAESSDTPASVGPYGLGSLISEINRTGVADSQKDNVPEDYIEASLPDVNAELSLLNKSQLSGLEAKKSVQIGRVAPANANTGSPNQQQVTLGRKRKKEDKPEANTDGGKKNHQGFTLEESEITSSDLAARNTFLKHATWKKISIGKYRKGILISGAKGTGKSILAKAIIGQLKIPYIEVSADDLSSSTSYSDSAFESLLEFVTSSAPCAVLIENIVANQSAEYGRQDDTLRKRLTKLFRVNHEKKVIRVIATALKRSSVDQSLMGKGYFEVNCTLDPPKEKARLEILTWMLRREGVTLAPCVDVAQIARNTPGYAPGDLSELIEASVSEARLRVYKERRAAEGLLTDDDDDWSVVEEVLPLESEVEVTAADFEIALKETIPAARDHSCFVENTGVTWDDIGGMQHVRKQLEKCFLRPVKHSDTMRRVGRESRPQGVLLYGPPGCGKTLVAQALANEASLSFLTVNGPQLLSKYVGETEDRIKDIFDKAQASAPSVIYFDELDSIGQKRENGEGSTKVNTVTQLLTILDGMKKREKVFAIASTNRLDAIDPALLRPGRLTKHIKIGLPDKVDRYKILKAITRIYPKFEDDVDLKKLASDRRCENMSGAHLDELIDCAVHFRLDEEDLDVTDENARSDENYDIRVGNVHLEAALDEINFQLTNDKLEM